MSYIDHDEVGAGVNIDTERHDYIRCARCGWMCLESRDSHFPEGSRVGWGMRYERNYIETTIASATISEVPGTVTEGAILTEEGLQILTEDGTVIIEE
jgi:hypothetical protein